MIVPIINIINLRYLYVILLVLIQLGVARADAEAEADPAACCRRVSEHLFINLILFKYWGVNILLFM